MGIFEGIISGLGNIGGSLITAGAQKRENRRSREFSREMYDRTRQDALTDWERQTMYNSPQAQRQRLEEAGFSPALMYGKGGAAAGGSAGPVRSAEVKQAQFQAPDYRGLGDALTGTINQIYRTRMMKQQTNLMEQKVQGELLENMIKANKAAVAGHMKGYAPQIARMNLQAQQENLVKLENQNIEGQFRARKSNVDFQLARASFPQQLEILKNRAARSGKELRVLDELLRDKQIRNQLNQIMLDWRKLGFTEGDNTLIRFMVSVLRNHGGLD